MKRIIILIFATIFSASSFAAISLTNKSLVSLDSASYNNWSGITYVGEKDGASLFFLTRETSGVASTFGCPSGAIDGLLLQPMSVRFGTDGSILSQTIGAAFAISGVNDPEDVAYDPAGDSLWVADEGNKSIVEYRFTDDSKSAVTPTYRSVPLPDWFKDSLQKDIGVQSVSISGDGLTLWTANDDSLSGDGDTSFARGTSAGPIIRLLKYTRESIIDGWTLSAVYAYQCDACATKGVSAMGFSYDACHSGVSSLVALPKGAANEVLVIERNADTDTVGRTRVYAPTFNGATDVKAIAALNGASYTKVAKGTALGEYCDGSRADKTLGVFYRTYHIVDYEGATLGPRLANGSIAMLMVASGGLNFKYDLDLGILNVTFKIDTYTRLRSFAVNGLDAYRLDFVAPDGVQTIPCGKGYLYMNGSQVSCSVPSAAIGSYAPRFTYGWRDPNDSYIDSVNANFTISGGGAFTCVERVDESSMIYAADSFEGYAERATTADIAGWSGDTAAVTAATPEIGAPPGYPMAGTTHKKVLELKDGEVIRDYDGSTGNRSFDALVKVVLGDAQIEVADSQIAIIFNREGRAVIYHGDGVGGVETTTIPDMIFKDGGWVRVSLIFDYTTGPTEFVQVRLNGSPCWSQNGVQSPSESTKFGGSWYRAIVSNTSLNSFKVVGDGAVDDVILRDCTAANKDEFEIAAATGKEVAEVDGVPVAWFNAFGLPWRGSMLAPGGSGYTLGEVFKTGLNPFEEAKLTITRFEIYDDGTYDIETNGAKSNPNAKFTVQRADTPYGPWSATSEGNFFRVIVE